MTSGTRREEDDQGERGLILGGTGCFLEELGPGWGSSSLRKSASDAGGGGHLQGMDTERTETGGARAHRGSEKGFQNLPPLIRSPRDNE